MQTLGKYLLSSVGRKQLMGLSGIYLYFFLLIHLVGNIGLLSGPEYFNKYGYLMLHTMAKVVYPIEVSLLVAFLLHVGTGLKLAFDNRAARPERYAVNASKSGRSPLSRFMALTGSWMLLFVVIHVPHFRFGVTTTLPTVIYQGVEMRDLYSTAMEAFAKPWYTGFYIVSFLLIGVHLAHGVQSSLQSLGLAHNRYATFVQRFSRGYALIICGSFILLAIWAFVKSGGL
jgi:succinate dehydrogenase / fumarate reductase, cytochrome b subunit